MTYSDYKDKIGQWWTATYKDQPEIYIIKVPENDNEWHVVQNITKSSNYFNNGDFGNVENATLFKRVPLDEIRHLLPSDHPDKQKLEVIDYDIY